MTRRYARSKTNERAVDSAPVNTPCSTTILSSICLDGKTAQANDWSESFATYSITKDQDLIESRERGADNYVGTYEASYTQFDGEEYIFGGTSLKRKDGGDLYATYSLTVQSGEATPYWMNGDNKIVIADTSNEGIYEFTIHAGENFIVLEGETFTGTLDLNVSQNSVSDDIATDFGRAQDIRETSDLLGLDWNGKETENEKLS